MKDKHRVSFAQTDNDETLAPNTLKWARNIADVLVTRNEMLSSEFVFKFGVHVDVRDPEYDVEEVYVASLSGIRLIEPNEKLMCAYLQYILNAEKTIERVRAAIGYIVEYYHFINKARSHGKRCVTHSANLLIDGGKFRHGTREQIDIGVDRLDGDWALEMCECTTRVERFRTSKIDQIVFYANAFEEIRRVLDSRVILTMELVVGLSTSKGWRDVFNVLPSEFGANRIKVVGKTLATGQETILHNPRPL